LVNIVTDLADGTSEFVVLDARDVEAGPVASVTLPRRVPFGFHGNWMAAAG
jgi:carotenoid cleavage dioxygenase